MGKWTTVILVVASVAALGLALYATFSKPAVNVKELDGGKEVTKHLAFNEWTEQVNGALKALDHPISTK